MALREQIGFSLHTTSMSLGLQLANYRQRRDATRPKLIEHTLLEPSVELPESFPLTRDDVAFRSHRFEYRVIGTKFDDDGST